MPDFEFDLEGLDFTVDGNPVVLTNGVTLTPPGVNFRAVHPLDRNRYAN